MRLSEIHMYMGERGKAEYAAELLREVKRSAVDALSLLPELAEFGDIGVLDALISGAESLAVKFRRNMYAGMVSHGEENPNYLTALPWKLDGKKYVREWAADPGRAIMRVSPLRNDVIRCTWIVYRVEAEATYAQGVSDTSEEAMSAADAAWDRYLAEISAGD